MAGGMPTNIGDVFKNMGFISTYMETLKQNPEMLRAIIGMLGDSHPLSSLIKRSSTQDLRKYIGYI